MDSVLKMIYEDKATKYQASEFDSQFITDLEHDIKVLKEIDDMWDGIDQDPKLDEFVEFLRNDKNIENSKILIFTSLKKLHFI